MNPRRKRRRRYRANVPNPGRRRRRHGRRRYRRNPGMGRGFMGQIQAAMPAVGWGSAGFVATSALPGLAARFGVPVPDRATQPLMHYGVKAVSAVATAWIVRMFAGGKAASYALAGGGINVLADVIVQFAGPTLGLSEYIEPGMQEYIERGPMGYLSPGEPLSGFSSEYDEPVARLNPDNRF